MNAEARPILVVGGGFAGLSAAWQLRAAGLPVVVLEQASKPGGRACGERIEGFSVESRLPLVSSGASRLRNFMAAVGVQEGLLPLRFVSMAHLHRGRPRAVKIDSLRGLASTPGLGLRDGFRLLRLPRLLQRYQAKLDLEFPERAAALDYRSVADFARLYFGSNVLDRWVAPTLATASGGSPEDTSRVAFLLQWLRESRGEIALPRAGWEALARAAAERLSMRYGFAAREIVALEDGGYRVACEVATSGAQTLEARAVVLAIPAPAVCKVAGSCLSLTERDALLPVRYAPEALLVLGLDRARTGIPEFLRIPKSESSPIQAVLSEPGFAGGRVPNGRGMLMLQAREDFVSARAGVADDVVAKEIEAAYEQIDPGATGTVRFRRWLRSELAVPCFDVGSYRRLARFQKIQPELRREGRRLYFAGDYLQGPDLDALVVSGERAAGALIADERLPA
ncbi:MAG: FAD-dependent oxidoreductase [Myxococcota bacterium]|jgi:oxygen-dependent protoporphyrinogen oxidase